VGALAPLVLLAPLLGLGVSALVRKRGAAPTALLFGFCSPLLLPSRDGNVAAALALFEILTLALIELRAFRHDPALKTREGLAARALLVVPCGILLVRNAFYTYTPMWAASVAAAPSLVALTLPGLSAMPLRPARILQACGMAGLFVALGLTGADPRLLGLAASVLALAGTLVTDLDAKVFARLGGGAFVIACGAGAVAWTPAFALLVLPVGALHVLSAYQRRSVPLFVTASIATLVGLLAHWVALIRLPTHDLWLAPAALGIALLSLASVCERYRGALERTWLRFSSRFGAEP
jgi:hypothetical protein